jgi:transcriptional regulator with XRE-family HTH domain
MYEPRVKTVLGYVGANVRRLRTARGMIQQELADAAGVHLRFVQRIELGRTNLGVEVLVKMADALGVDPRALLKPAKLPEVKRGRPPKKKPAT